MSKRMSKKILIKNSLKLLFIALSMGVNSAFAVKVVPYEKIVQVEKSVIKQKADELVAFAKQNNMLIGENTVKIGDITNYVYQLQVNKQGVNTCGPRACFNCLKLIEYFDPEASKGTAEIQESFKLVYEEANEKVDDFLKNVAKKLSVNYPPEDLNETDLGLIKDNNNIQIVEGYEDLRLLDIINLPEQKEGFFRGYVFKNGIVENGWTQSEAANYFVDAKGFLKCKGRAMGDHWICLFVVKTGQKEYSWFIADSLNHDRVNSDRTKAYIHTLFGQTYKPYDDFLIAQRKVIDEKTEYELMAVIVGMVSNLEDKEVKEKIKRQYEKIGKTETSPAITLSENDYYNRFFAEKIIEISAMRYADQKVRTVLIDMIVKAGRGAKGSEFLNMLNKDIISLKAWSGMDIGLLAGHIKSYPAFRDIVLGLFNRLTKNGYAGAENLKNVILSSVNAFGSEIKRLESVIGEFYKTK